MRRETSRCSFGAGRGVVYWLKLAAVVISTATVNLTNPEQFEGFQGSSKAYFKSSSGGAGNGVRIPGTPKTLVHRGFQYCT